MEQSTEIAKGYINLAENSLGTMNRERKQNLVFSVSACYYSLYYSLYSIIAKIGIKSEIHACTIEFMKRFLSSYYTPAECKFMADSLQARVDTQYYINRDVKDQFVKEMISTTPKFLIKCKGIVANIKESEINEIRKQLQKS